MKHQLREQQLYCDIETAWEFFISDEFIENNTQRYGFTVLSDFENEPIYEGMLIDYTVSPILGIPLKWKTRITQVRNNKVLPIFNKKVPYKYWNHFHEFIPNEDFEC